MLVEQSQGLPIDEGLTSVVNRAYDARLVRLCRGDNDAWEEVISESQTRLYSYLLYNVPSAEDAQDLLSEIYMAALRSIASLDSSDAMIRWLYGIAPVSYTHLR